MPPDYLKELQDRAGEIVPALYDFARKLAARKYHWREGKSLPLGKSPEDVVTDVYVSYARGAANPRKRTKGVRHFDPDKDMLLQLKGSVKSAMWALTDRASAKNELLATTDDDSQEVEFAPTDPTPYDLVESADFAKAAVEGVKRHQKLHDDKSLADLLALFELEITEVADQARELNKNPDEICQLRYQLRQTYTEVIDQLNR